MELSEHPWYLVRVADAATLLALTIDDDVFDAPLDRDRLSSWLARPDHLMVVAVVGDAPVEVVGGAPVGEAPAGTVVGQAQAMVLGHLDHGTELFVDNLGVAEAHRRRGIATALLQDILAWGRSRGCRTAWVVTEDGAVGADAFYASFGSAAEGATVHAIALG